MKKFAKGSLITAGILAAIGIVLCGVSLLVGGRNVIAYGSNSPRVLKELQYVGRAIEDLFGVHWHYSNENGMIDMGFSDDAEDGGFHLEKKQFQADEVTGMELDVGAGKFTIQEKDTDDGIIDIDVSGVGNISGVGAYSAYVDERGILHMEAFKLNGKPDFYPAENEVVIKFPKGKSWDDIVLIVGAGLMELSDVRAKELSAEVGAGQLVIKDVDAGEFSVEIGAGQMTAERVETRDAEFTLGLGECVFEGSISGNLDAECDMGNMELTLYGKEDDHNYEVECSMGNIDMGSHSMAAFAGEKYIDNGKNSTFDISCNMGNVSLKFKENR